MKTKIYNAKIMTLENDCSIIEGEIHIDNDKISYVGEQKADDTIKWDKTIDAKGNVLMPGFKNAHTHSAMTFLRSYADDMPLMDWLNKLIFPMEAKLKPEYICSLTKLAIMEYLSSGTTANFDMYFHEKEIARAAIETGFRTVILGIAVNDAKDVEKQAQLYQEFKNYHPLITYQLGFHAEYTSIPAVLDALTELAHSLKVPIYTHNSETEGEVAACIERHGMTPTAYLDSLGLYDYGGGSYHGVHLTDADREIMHAKNVSLVTNPAANLKLASGIADIKSAVDKGINIAIGTDGPAGNNALDMFREMFLVTGLAKVFNKDAAAVPADEVLMMATKGGAKAMCLDDCDCLAVGKQADIIMIDLSQPNMQPINNIAKNIVYSGSKSNVKMTMIAGVVRYYDGEFFIGEEPEKIYSEANRIINSMR